MTTFSVAAGRPRRSRPGLVRVLAGAFSALGARWRRRRTMLTLAELDDHALRDIGLTRSQIGDLDVDPRYAPRSGRR